MQGQNKTTRGGWGGNGSHLLVRRPTYEAEWLRNRPPRQARCRGWRRLRGGTAPQQASHLRGAATTSQTKKQKLAKPSTNYISSCIHRHTSAYVPYGALACAGKSNKVPYICRRWQQRLVCQNCVCNSDRCVRPKHAALRTSVFAV